jgi:hypothetical protein
MKFASLGLRGKLIVALLIAVVLPFLLGLAFFETIGYRYLLEERGKLHQMQATTLVRALNQASDAQGKSLRSWMAADPAIPSFIHTINQRDAGRDPQDIARETQRLDDLWASFPANDPQLLAVLENPASISLRRFQMAFPEVAEVLATDVFGRLIAASGKSSDFNQADEEWWQKGATLKKSGAWIDLLRFDASSGVYSLDVVMPIHDGASFAGVVKISVNVTSLFAGLVFIGKESGDRWEIALPDGLILASSKSSRVPLKDRLPEQTVETIRRRLQGWALIRDENGEARMAGFISMAPPARPPARPTPTSCSRPAAMTWSARCNATSSKSASPPPPFSPTAHC